MPHKIRILPPALSESDANFSPARPSDRVIVKLHGFDHLWFARYMWELECWHVEGVHGTNDPDVDRWWHPDELNRGYKYEK